MTTVSQRSQFKSSFIADSSSNATGVCPFCGTTGVSASNSCPGCGTQDSPVSRERAKSTVGPWQVLDPNHPSAQGINFHTLKLLISEGRVIPTSVVRGPTTAQLWKPAGKVKGLSREFGLCYSCDARIDRTAALCPNCNRSQTLPFDPDMLLDASSPIPMPAPTSPLSTQPWVEEAPTRVEPVAVPRSARKPFKRDLLLTPGDLAKVFQLSAGPVSNLDYRPRRNRRQIMRKIGIRATLVVLLIGGTAAAVHESLATGPLAWQWVQKTLKGSSTSASSSTVSTSSPTVAVVTAPIAVAPQAESTPSPSPTPAAALASARVAAAPMEPDPVDVSPDQTVHDLWSQGLTAESQRHFTAAVKCYEQILSYPNTYWPATLNLRLRLARQEVANGTR